MKEWSQGLIIGAVISVICIVLFSVFFGYPMWNTRESKDTAPNNIHVFNKWDCEEGCIYAERFVFGEDNNLTKPSDLYNNCSAKCRGEY